MSEGADPVELGAGIVECLTHLLQDLGLGIAMVSSLGTPPADSSDLVGFQVVPVCAGNGISLNLQMHHHHPQQTIRVGWSLVV